MPISMTPCISADDLELYFVSRRSGGYGDYDLWVTTRTTVNDDWGAPINLGPTINSPSLDCDPVISPDGLLLFFSSTRPGGMSGQDIYVARRATRKDPWGPSMNLGPILNSTSGQRPGSVSFDGSMLYFFSSRPGGYGSRDIWQAPIVPIVDFNGDGKVDGKELLTMAEHWGQNDPLCDIGPFAWGDGVVDVQDLKVLAAYIGKDVEDPTFIAHWAFDETQGNTAHDSVGGNDATVMGMALWQPEGGEVGGALQLNGAPNFATAKSVRNPSEGSLSVFAWVKGGAPGQVILSQAGGANWLMAGAGAGALTTELKQAGTTGKALVSSCVITDGAWHRVGFTWDGSNRILYVDDVEVARDAQAGLASSTGSLSIGAGSTMAPASFWKGLIDDVRIYDRAVQP